ncbi:TrmH family RNA methyltransferase [Dactylosporangium sp. AC04546]|uniref:TrmH family RNA methyltransferase n=1 Tax=Dactylosporangium sp. AC04546 TaxID=2862460 RepID=UPI001EE0907D|nr:TrmH family RNA methyltransferase [Dactylosporangium sp. AC04546]WVK89868.1 TrmH family RNA methyltransferase [Dactylosporangium sp. AC04546]
MELQAIGVQHPAVRQVQHIQNNTAPNRYRLFVAEGLWAHNMLLEHNAPIDTFFWCPEAIYADEAHRRAEEIASRAERAYRVSLRTLEKISERDKPDGLLSLAALPQWAPEDLRFGRQALVLVADGVEIPGNLGTLIRSLDACAADALVLTNRKTRLTHPKVIRASQGTILTVPTLEFPEVAEAVAWLHRHRFTVLLADTDNAINYRKADFSGRTALVVGSERYGIAKPWYEHGYQCVAVPMLGSGDSLNVSVSASVLLYEAKARKSGW